jgi:hypothetical protein
MRLLAVKIGAGVPADPFSGSVRSTFANAAILTVAERLVTVAPSTAGGLPGAITVDVPGGFNFAGVLTVVAKPPLRPRPGPLRSGDGARLGRGCSRFAEIWSKRRFRSPRPGGDG